MNDFSKLYSHKTVFTKKCSPNKGCVQKNICSYFVSVRQVSECRPPPPQAQKWPKFVSRRYKNEQMFKNHNLAKTIRKTLLLLNVREHVLIWKFSVDVKLVVTRKINICGDFEKKKKTYWPPPSQNFKIYKTFVV